MIMSSNSVWVFDLDDTLYKEIDYQLSGYMSINQLVEKVYKKSVKETILSSMNAKQDVLLEICNRLSLPLNIKDSLLWQYRNHLPIISLDDETKKFLADLEKKYPNVAILTDGRSITQRAKIEALGLSHFDLYISEEWCENKPGDKRFLSIMERNPYAESFIYIGDNVQKDFITPNKLGWITIGLKDDGRNIHSQDLNTLSLEFYPQYWVNSLKEIQEL